MLTHEPNVPRHGGSWLPAGKIWQVPSANLQAALKELAAAPGLRVEVEDMHPITDKIMQVGLLLQRLLSSLGLLTRPLRHLKTPVETKASCPGAACQG